MAGTVVVDTRDPALLVQCPECNADIYEACHDASGSLGHKTHMRRLALLTPKMKEDRIRFVRDQLGMHEEPILKDLKEALSSSRKADTTHVRRAFQIYTARPCDYGSMKYERGNYRRPTGGTPHTVPTKADFERFRAYLRAARDHLDDCLDSMEAHLANDPNLLDTEGMKRAAYAIDTDVSPGSEWLGPSNLPHVAPACASLNMAITQATDCGLLPKDPGTPWNTKAVKP